MESKLARQQLIEIVEKLMNAEGTEEQCDEWLRLIERNVPDPAVSDLIFWPNVRGFEDNLTAEQIVGIALSYKPMVIELRPRTNSKDS